MGGLILLAISYNESLGRRAEKKSVRIKFYLNAFREELIKITTSSKIFVHVVIE